MKKLLLVLLFPIWAYGQIPITDAALTVKANAVRNAGPGANTKELIATFFQSIIDSKLNVSLSASVTASGTDTYVAATIPALAAYTSGFRILVKFTNANTGPSTINISTQGAKGIRKAGDIALVVGDILAGQILWLSYDGTNFQIIGGSGGGGTAALISAHLLIGSAGNIATDNALTGDASITNAGVLTVNKIKGNIVPVNAAGFLSNNGAGVLSWAGLANGNGILASGGTVSLGGAFTGDVNWTGGGLFPHIEFGSGIDPVGEVWVTTPTTQYRFGAEDFHAWGIYSSGGLVDIGEGATDINLATYNVDITGRNYFTIDSLNGFSFNTGNYVGIPTNKLFRIARSGSWIFGGFGGSDGQVIKQVGGVPRWSADVTGLSTSLASARIYVGNFSGNATSVAVTGDITMSNTGVVGVTKIKGNTIPIDAAGTLTNNGSGTLTWTSSGTATWGAITGTLSTQADLQSTFNTKVGTTLASGNLFVGNVSNVATAAALTGDASITNAGILTVNKILGNTVPANAAGSLTNNGSGTLSWVGAWPLVGTGTLDPSAVLISQLQAGTLTLRHIMDNANPTTVKDEILMDGTGLKAYTYFTGGYQGLVNAAGTYAAIISTLGSYNGGFYAFNNEVSMEAKPVGTNVQRLEFTSTGMIVTDQVNSKGLIAAADFSANYTGLSYVSQQYVLGAKTSTGIQTFTLTPIFTAGIGSATATTQAPGTSNTTVATTDFVMLAIAAGGITPLTSTTDGYLLNAGVAYKNLYSDGTWVTPGAVGTLWVSNGATSKATWQFPASMLIGGSSIGASAILDVQSTSKGVLLPRMTSAQINAIGSPAAGLMVYDTDNQQVKFYGGPHLAPTQTDGWSALPQVIRVTINSSTLLNLFTTPTALINPAPTGYYHQILGITWHYTFSGAAYATNTDLYIRYGSAGPVIVGLGAYVITGVADNWGYAAVNNTLPTATNLTAQSIGFTVNTGNPTAGGGNLVFSIVYITLPL